ncbi:hypothetical protein D3C87_1772260 [compost metagenome]
MQELAHLVAVHIGLRIAELALECVLHDEHVAVLTENKRHHEPVIVSSYTAVFAVVSFESTVLPMAYVWLRV